MEPWIWLILALVGFGLLQVVLYRYFGQDPATERKTGQPGARTDTGGDPGAYPREPHPGEPGLDPRRAETETAGDGNGLHCTRCGAHNDADSAYTYCRECVQPLR